ncbi:PREDICTED: matrix metalloproteinase-16 [Papilio polytes]|uniref:matrix metalloproteinase-16 n=1 Tax=Papilio polytes TaxID=76194 RepID=UPI000675D2BE|nr:PREDICTED: matrix metalloproteinase-16 [Papilio polytes]
MSLISTRESNTRSNMALVSLRSSLRILWTIAAAFVFLSRSSAAPTFGDTDKAMMYLAQYGYLSPSVRNPSSGHIMDESSWRRAIAEFQSFAGLNATGELDDETAKVMSLPRCGVRDKVGFGESRAKRYALQGSRWRVKNLTYKISKYPSRLNQGEVDAELAKAFSVWSDYTDLTFTQKRSGQVHIEIRFEKGEHGDGDPFDGPGGTLAHAYFPVYGGDAHFDDAEVWSINSRRGTNLFQVAAHEFGHSLVSRAWPGLPANIDAAFTYKNGKTYFFKGSKYWRYNGQNIDGDYPKEISEGFTGIPDNIDAALVWSGNGKIYFYKGAKFWRFDPAQRPPVKSTYPKPLSNWEGIPDSIDAALQYTNGYTYFFKGGSYWRFNDRTFSVDTDKPAFPRSTGYWWLGCSSAPRGTVGGNARLSDTNRAAAYTQLPDEDDVGDILFDAVGHIQSDGAKL